MSDNEQVSYTHQSDNISKGLSSIGSLLKESQNILPTLRREFRGEAISQYEDGSFEYIQVSKPLFVKMDFKSNKPLKRKVIYKNKLEKEIYIANDEAIEEILSMIKFLGVNSITMITNLDENTILDDLKEFECKLAAILALKQKEWGMDKELLPMVMTKIKTIVQDVRYMCLNGSTIKAIQKTVQRTEQYIEGGGNKVKTNSPYT